MNFFYTIVLIIFTTGCQLTDKLSSENSSQTNQSVIEVKNVTVDKVEIIPPSEDMIISKKTSAKNDKQNKVAETSLLLVEKQPVEITNIWYYLQSKFTLSYKNNKRITQQRNWYLKHPHYFKRVAKRAEPFLFYIVTQLENNNIPLEIALLPIVESAFDPFAYSHGSASGMWQFVPATGRRYGMKQNWWYDGRRDVIASTQGAIDYLKYLHKYFNNNWMLALAAYNSGEGRVRRAIKKNKRKGKSTDFWSLDLPKETRAYVPKLFALIDIVKNAQQYNFTLHAIANKAVITPVEIGSQLDLAKAANLANISLAYLHKLNPGFNRWATDPDGPHRLLLPINEADNFLEALSNTKPKDRISWQRYQIKSGDSLSTIAAKFDTQVSLIKSANKLNSHRIRAGKYLLIPTASASLDEYIYSQTQRLAKKQNRQYQGTKLIHTVKSGDNFWDLGRQYKVSSNSIARWNGMSPKDTLSLGKKLVIWQKTAQQVMQKAPKTSYLTEQKVMRNITYRVRKGDSFARIADKFNIKINDIERWNKLNRKEYLQPGQMLRLSVDVTNNI